MRTPISHEDTTVIMAIEDIIQKEYKMSEKELRAIISKIDRRLANLEGRFLVVSGILGVLGLAMLNYLMDILKMLQSTGG